MPARPLRLLLLCAALSASSATADDKPGEKIDVAKMTELPVLVTDADGHPVAGAAVLPYAMQVNAGLMYWNPTKFGPLRWSTSNDQGVAVIRYPENVDGGLGEWTTTSVSLRIIHVDCIRKEVDFDLGPERAEVHLEPGCEVRLAAVDGDGNPVKDFGVVMAGPFAPELWTDDASGGRRSGSVRPGTWQTLLVKLQDDGPILFSDVLPLRVRPNQILQLGNIQLSPGAKIRGRLSRNVPRPVKGHVMAVSYPQPAGKSWDEENPSVAWHDWVQVAEDGSFEFASLPRGGVVELIAVCEGWISATTVEEDFGFFIKGQLFNVDANVVDLEVAMEPTGTLRVEVVTKDGQPVTQGRIATAPNQAFYKGGGGLLGERDRSVDEIRKQRLPLNRRTPPPGWSSALEMGLPYIRELNEKGVAVLTGIPIGRGLDFDLLPGRWKLVKKGADGVSFELPSAEPVTIKVTAAAKE